MKLYIECHSEAKPKNRGVKNETLRRWLRVTLRVICVNLWLNASLSFAQYNLTSSTEPEKKSTLDNILEKMEEADSKITDLSFSFNQEILITITKEKSEVKGNAVFKKPDLFKIEHAEPEKQIVVSDGKKIFFYQKGFNQVMIDDWKSFAGKGHFPTGILNFSSTITDLQKNYNLSLSQDISQDKEKYFVLLLVPKEAQQHNIKIKLWISKESYLAEKTEMLTETVSTTVNISGIKTNRKIKDSFFRFKIPKGAQIITSPF